MTTRPVIHPEAWIAPGAVVVGRVTLGRAASVWYGCVLRADDDEIVVGAECNIQDLSCLHVDAGEPAVLEDRVSLGHRAMVHGAYIETGALVGIGAVVLGRRARRGRDADRRRHRRAAGHDGPGGRADGRRSRPDRAGTHRR